MPFRGIIISRKPVFTAKGREATVTDFSLIYKHTVSSTNDDVKNLIMQSDCPVYVCEYASVQTGGKGRRGRSFVSPEGGIYFSFTVPLESGEGNIPFLTSLAGRAVAEAIEKHTGAKVGIKWPNDIYVNGKKICGMLAELVSNSGKLTAVMGIGVNNRRIIFPEEIRSKAGCLEDEIKVVEDIPAFINDVITNVYTAVYDSHELISPLEKTVETLRALSCSIGKTALYGDKTGTVIDINADGSLKMRFDDGIKDISTGEIVHFENSGD